MTYQEIAFETVTVNRQGQIIDREQRQAQQFVEKLANGVVLELIAIPGGAFLMGLAQGRGYDDERPQHRVKVAPFLMGKHPVTQAQWAAVMGQHTGRFSGDLRAGGERLVGRGPDVLPPVDERDRPTTPSAERGRVGVCLPRR